MTEITNIEFTTEIDDTEVKEEIFNLLSDFSADEVVDIFSEIIHRKLGNDKANA